MFAAAARHPWVAGVVAWIPLDDPPRASGRWVPTTVAGKTQLRGTEPRELRN